MGQAVNGLSTPRHLFATETVHVVFVADRVGLGKVFMRFGLSLSVLPALCTLATGSVE
jgi:hypothetical protein